MPDPRVTFTPSPTFPLNPKPLPPAGPGVGFTPSPTFPLTPDTSRPGPGGAAEVKPNARALRLKAVLASPAFQKLKAQNKDAADQYIQHILNNDTQPLPQMLIVKNMKAPTAGSARRPLSPTEAQNLASLDATYKQLNALRNQLQKIGPDRWNRANGRSRVILGVETAGAPTRYAQKYGRELGMPVASGDPDVAQLNDALGNLITQNAQATAALLKTAGTRNFQFATQARGHMPDAAYSYEVNMSNLNNLLSADGPYINMMNDIKNGTGDLPYEPPVPQQTQRSSANIRKGLAKHGLIGGP